MTISLRDLKAKRAAMTQGDSLWRKLHPDERAPSQCDLCFSRPIWTHPAGGFRCRRCPRPDK